MFGADARSSTVVVVVGRFVVVVAASISVLSLSAYVTAGNLVSSNRPLKPFQRTHNCIHIIQREMTATHKHKHAHTHTVLTATFLGELWLTRCPSPPLDFPSPFIYTLCILSGEAQIHIVPDATNQDFLGQPDSYIKAAAPCRRRLR